MTLLATLPPEQCSRLSGRRPRHQALAGEGFRKIGNRIGSAISVTLWYQVRAALLVDDRNRRQRHAGISLQTLVRHIDTVKDPS
jgi:hypothetical protein